MWTELAISGGLSLLQQGMAYKDAKAAADSKRAWQSYKNAMVELSNSSNQSILTTNAGLARDASSDQAFNISRSEYLTSAQAEVAAAASGTGGRSPNDVLFDIGRNADYAQHRRKQDLEAQYLQIDNQRQQSAFQAAMSKDYSPIPEPNPATYMLNFATDAYKLYRSGTPK
jgi:hypothetical protein